MNVKGKTGVFRTVKTEKIISGIVVGGIIFISALIGLDTIPNLIEKYKAIYAAKAAAGSEPAHSRIPEERLRYTPTFA